MTGYSTNHGQRVELHHDSCHCPACIDVANVEQDNGATLNNWMDKRRLTEADAARADEMVAAARGKFPTLATDEYLMSFSDQYEDWRDWQLTQGHIE